jgi:YfiH family protein
MSMANSISASWPAPDKVKAFTTIRTASQEKPGTSTGVYSNFNLAEHVYDQLPAVLSNRQLLNDIFKLPSEPVWLKQTHSNRVINADLGDTGCADQVAIEADASWTSKANIVCAVMTADCLPVFFTNSVGSCVAIAHAGWKGLLNGIISSTFFKSGLEANDCLVWLGPAIGSSCFEVGEDVVQAFAAKDSKYSTAFTNKDASHWLCDLYVLARIELEDIGIHKIYGGDLCTHSDEEKFYSYRRDGETGRMASLIWIDT